MGREVMIEEGESSDRFGCVVGSLVWIIYS